MTISVGAALCRLLEECRGDGMVLGRVGADDHDDVGVLDLVEGGGHGAGADALDQRRHRRGMAQPRAVIDVVVAEARADQLLEQISLFVRAFGRAESGDGAVAMLLGDRASPLAATSNASSQLASRKWRERV